MRKMLIIASLLVLSACREPAPIPDDPPEPQAAATADASQLREAIQEPIDKAREVEATQAADEAERQQALQDAGG